MASHETRDTTQEVTPTITSVQGARNRTRRIAVDDTLKTITIPDRVSGIIVMNDGAEDISMYMGPATGPDFFKLKIGMQPLNILINDGTVMGLRCATGLTSVLRCIFY